MDADAKRLTRCGAARGCAGRRNRNCLLGCARPSSARRNAAGRNSRPDLARLGEDDRARLSRLGPRTHRYRPCGTTGRRMCHAHPLSLVRLDEALGSEIAAPVPTAKRRSRERPFVQAVVEAQKALGDHLILVSLNSTCLRATGSYLVKVNFSVLVRAFFLVT